MSLLKDVSDSFGATIDYFKKLQCWNIKISEISFPNVVQQVSSVAFFSRKFGYHGLLGSCCGSWRVP